MSRNLDFYFFIGSTYTYVAVNRASALAARHGVTLNWHPFSLRTLLREQGNSPFLGKASKLNYMWRDLERRAQRFDIPFSGRPQYPVDPDSNAGHVATLAAREGWCEQFVLEAYRTWFLEKLDPGSPEVLAKVLSVIGKPADTVERARDADIVTAYSATTDTARALGIFGSPTFVHGGKELFWGDDRLEDAIEWACASDT